MWQRTRKTNVCYTEKRFQFQLFLNPFRGSVFEAVFSLVKVAVTGYFKKLLVR